MVDQRANQNCEPWERPAASGLDIGTLITAYHREVYRYAYRLCGRPADAEDLTQQTFLVAQQRLHQVRQAEKVAGWLFTILRNCYLKSQTKRQPISAASVELDVDKIPEEVADEDIDRAELQAAIDTLPDDFKIVVVMFYFQECSYKEIAAELGISIGTVMSRLARAKGRLRKCLLADDKQEGPCASRASPGEVERRSPLTPPTIPHPRP
jgi:RNA polymerase sigma-70 factor (ECF subfamily)